MSSQQKLSHQALEITLSTCKLYYQHTDVGAARLYLTALAVELNS